MDKIRWTDCVRNEEVLLRVKEQRNILHEISKRKANWDRLCGLVVRVSGYRYRGPGFDPRRYQIF